MTIRIGITDPATLANLLRHDATYGTWHVPVYPGENTLSVNGRSIVVTSERDPERTLTDLVTAVDADVLVPRHSGTSFPVG